MMMTTAPESAKKTRANEEGRRTSRVKKTNTIMIIRTHIFVELTARIVVFFSS